MITAKELELDHNKHGITVVGTYGPKTIIKYDFENGDNVGLSPNNSRKNKKKEDKLLGNII
jgi:hypothetical protein